MVRWLAALALFAAALVCAAPALAQDAPKPVVVAPALKKDAPATYPKQALDDGVRETVTVTLVLNIDASGKVTSAASEVARGHGFDEASADAARGLEFSPATKDGKAVPARVKYQYVFAPPPGRLTGRVVSQKGDRAIAGASVTLHEASGTERKTTSDATGSYAFDDVPFGEYRVIVRAAEFVDQEAPESVAPGQEVTALVRLAPVPVVETTPDAGAPKKTDDIEDVTVHGEKPPREVTKRTIDQRELLRIPGTNGDALRALQNLPGVARPPGLAGLLIVRGSAPQDTLIFVDGTNIPLVYHFGGLSSVVPTEMLEKIDFYPGNFSAQYGRALGGIVDVGIRDPSPPCKPGEPRKGTVTDSAPGSTCGVHGLAQVDLIDRARSPRGPSRRAGASPSARAARGSTRGSAPSSRRRAPASPPRPSTTTTRRWCRRTGTRTTSFVFCSSAATTSSTSSRRTRARPRRSSSATSACTRSSGASRRATNRSSARTPSCSSSRASARTRSNFYLGNIYFTLDTLPLTGAPSSRTSSPRARRSTSASTSCGRRTR